MAAEQAAPDAVGAYDPRRLLALAETEFGGGEQPIDDHAVLPDAVIDELALAFRSDDEEWRQLALSDAARELDEHLPRLKNVSLTYLSFRLTWTRQEPEGSLVMVAMSCAPCVQWAIETERKLAYKGVHTPLVNVFRIRKNDDKSTF